MAGIQKAFCIPMWFHLEQGHEPTNHGRIIIRALDWFRARVHTGETVQTLKEEIGYDRAARVVFLYDQACQWTASQTIERRGWLLDRLGKPQSATQIAAEHGLDPDWLAPVIGDSVKCKWLSLRAFARPLPHYFEFREKYAKLPHESATRNRTDPRPETENIRPETGNGDAAAGAANGDGVRSVGLRAPSASGRVGDGPVSDSEYRAIVARMFFGIADESLLTRICMDRPELPKLQKVLRAYRASKPPVNPAGYLFGMLKRRQLVTVGEDE